MTQLTELLSALKRGPMTKLQMLRELGIINGGGRIGELRKAGHDIRTDMIEVRSRRGTSVIAEYRLVQKRKRK